VGGEGVGDVTGVISRGTSFEAVVRSRGPFYQGLTGGE